MISLLMASKDLVIASLTSISSRSTNLFGISLNTINQLFVTDFIIGRIKS